jgi:hypothetical protein
VPLFPDLVQCRPGKSGNETWQGAKTGDVQIEFRQVAKNLRRADASELLVHLLREPDQPTLGGEASTFGTGALRRQAVEVPQTRGRLSRGAVLQ